MISAIESLLADYNPVTGKDYENALKQISQQLTLAALSRAKFFEHAAFYGGTALRILYGLDRFSEDLDFSLLQPNKDFDLLPYIDAVKRDLTIFGLKVEVEEKQKNHFSPVKSAFIKGGTKANLLLIEAPTSIVSRLTDAQKFKVKFELDTDPPPLAGYQMEFVLTPFPFAVKVFDKPSLFAGKLHAVLCRAWKSRVKGRDLYDLIWYLGKRIPCNLAHLRARMEQSEHLPNGAEFNVEELKRLLNKRFAAIDWEKAKEDVLPFVGENAGLELWSREFFDQIIENLKVTSQ